MNDEFKAVVVRKLKLIVNFIVMNDKIYFSSKSTQLEFVVGIL